MEMASGSRYGYAAQSFATWTTKKCAECGKTFECSADTRYRFENSFYCSYKCFRKEDKKRRDRVLAAIDREDSVVRANVAYYARKTKKPLEEQIAKAEKRVEVCRQKVGQYRAAALEAKDRRKYQTARENARKWVMKKAAAEDALRLLRLKGEKNDGQLRYGCGAD